MADTQFDLGEALGGYEQAQADRNFYLSMVQGGTQMASPIAAYLAGVSGVKMATMRQQAQAVEDKRQAEKDAIAATERAQKRADNLGGQLNTIVKGVRDGSIPASVGATLVGPIAKELGINIEQFNADEGILTGTDRTGERFNLDWSESETSKENRDSAKLELAKWREERLAKAAEDKAKIDAVKLQIAKQKAEDLASGKSNSGYNSAEIRFLTENKGIMNVINNPKGRDRREPVERRVSNYILQNGAEARSWLQGVKTLSQEAQQRLGAYTKEVATAAAMRGIITEEEMKKIYDEVNGKHAATSSAGPLSSLSDEDLLKMSPK